MAVTIASESLRLLFAMPVTDAITTMVMIGVRETVTAAAVATYGA